VEESISEHMQALNIIEALLAETFHTIFYDSGSHFYCKCASALVILCSQWCRKIFQIGETQ